MKNKQNGSAHGSKGRLANLLNNQPAKETPRSSNVSPTIMHPRSSLPELLKQSMAKPADSKSLNEELCAVLATTHSIQHSIGTRTTSLFNSMGTNINFGPSISHRANLSNLLFTTDVSETLFTEGPLSLKNSARALNTELEFNRTTNFARKFNRHESISSSVRSSPKCSLHPSVAHTRNSSLTKVVETAENFVINTASQLKLNENITEQNPMAKMTKSMSGYMPRKKRTVEPLAKSKPASPRLNNIKKPINKTINQNKTKDPESGSDEVIENFPEGSEISSARQKSKTPREKNLKPVKAAAAPQIQSARVPTSREQSIVKTYIEKTATPLASPKTSKLANKNMAAAPKSNKNINPVPSKSQEEVIKKVEKEAEVLPVKEEVTSIVLNEHNEHVVHAKRSVQVEITISEHQQAQQIEKKSLQIIYSENNEKVSQVKSIQNTPTPSGLSLGSLVSKIEFKEEATPHHVGMAIDLNFNSVNTSTPQVDQVENPISKEVSNETNEKQQVDEPDQTEKMDSQNRDLSSQGEPKLPGEMETSTDKVIEGFLEIQERTGIPSEPITPMDRSPNNATETNQLTDIVANDKLISPIISSINTMAPEIKEDKKEVPAESKENKDPKSHNKSFSSTDSEEEAEHPVQIDLKPSMSQRESDMLSIPGLEKESSKASSTSLSCLSSNSPTSKFFRNSKRSSALMTSEIRGVPDHISNFIKGSPQAWQNLKRRVSFVRSLIHEEEASHHSSSEKKRNSISSSQATAGTRRRTSILQTSIIDERRRSSLRSGAGSELSLNVSPRHIDPSQVTAAYLSAGQPAESPPKRKSLFANLENAGHPEQKGNDTVENKDFKQKFNLKQKNNKLKFNISSSILKESITSQASQRESSQTFLKKLANGGNYAKDEPGTGPFEEKSKIVDNKEASEKQKTIDFSTLLQRYDEASPVASRANLMIKQNSTRSFFSRIPTGPQKIRLSINIVPPQKEATSAESLEKIPEKQLQQPQQPSQTENKKREFEYVVQGKGDNYDTLEDFEDIEEKDFNLEIFLGEVGGGNPQNMLKFEDYFDPKYTFTTFFKYYEQIYSKKHPFAVIFYEEKLKSFEEDLMIEGRVSQAIIFPFCISPTHRIMKIAAADRVKTEREIVNDAFIQDLVKSKEEAKGNFTVEEFPEICLNDLNIKHHQNTGTDRPRKLNLQDPFTFKIFEGIMIYKHNPTLIHLTKEMYEAMDPDNQVSFVDYIAMNAIEGQNLITPDPNGKIQDMLRNTKRDNLEYIATSLIDTYRVELRGYFQHPFFIKDVTEADLQMQKKMQAQQTPEKQTTLMSRFRRASKLGVLTRDRARSQNTPVSSQSPERDIQSPMIAAFAQKWMDKAKKRRSSNIRDMSLSSERSFRNLAHAKAVTPDLRTTTSLLSPIKPSITVQYISTSPKNIEDVKTPPSSRFKTLARRAVLAKSDDEASKSQVSTPSNADTLNTNRDDTKVEAKSEAALQKPQLKPAPPKISKEKSLRRIFVNNHFVQEDKVEREKTFTKATVKAKEEKGINPVKLFFTYVQENKVAELKELFNNFPHLRVDTCDEKGNYPICMAAQSGFVNILRILLDREADINVQNREGNTALHLALAFAYTETADELIQAGAMQNIRNKKGRSPWECAG